MKTIKELLQTSVGTEGSKLIEKKIYDTLIEAVEKKHIGRGAAAFVVGSSGIPGSSVDIDLATPDSQKVYAVAEGGAVPIDVVDYTSFNLKPVKYGVRIPITKEMMEDGKWDLIEHNIKFAGTKIADNEDLLILRDALDNATNTQSGGAAVTISDVTRAIQYLEDSDYTATHIIVGPEVANDLRNIDTFVEAQKLGTREMFETGFIGRIYGMDVLRFSTNAAPTTTYSKYAYVIDKAHAFCIAEKRPVTVENYDDNVHDLSGAVITQRIVVRQLRAGAICKITSS